MKALVYEGPREVVVRDMPDARIERPTDVLVRITTTNICGSDLHMYEAVTDLESGRILGHENMGEVIEVGDGVDRVRVGDMVSLPFNISCGFCRNAARADRVLSDHSGRSDDGRGGVRIRGHGSYSGGQAEFLRVPYGDHNCLVLPEERRAAERLHDALRRLPTGWHATQLARVEPGDTVVIYGAGPVGLMAALSATLKSAAKVMVVDRHPTVSRSRSRSAPSPSTTPRGHPSTGSWRRPRGSARTGAVSAWATRHTTPRATSTPTSRSIVWSTR